MFSAKTALHTQTAKQVKDLMVGVVAEEDGSGRLAYSLDGFTSGGKPERLRLRMVLMDILLMNICIVISDLHLQMIQSL